MNNDKELKNKVPDKSLIFAKSTTIALFIVLVTLGFIFVILNFIK